jgi:DNA modification methylase
MRRGTTSVCKTDGSKESVEGKELQKAGNCSNRCSIEAKSDLLNGKRWDVITGDCLEILRGLPDGSVNCCVTSPPYFGLRKYGEAGEEIGQEQTPAEFVAALVAVFAEVRRLLKDDGTLWVNIGDSYSATGGLVPHGGERADRDQGGMSGIKRSIGRPKNLLMIPSRLALALQEAGWYLRSEIIWHKVAPMPESVKDRPTRAHEFIYLLTKSERYFYNWQEARDPLKHSSVARLGQDVAAQAGSLRGNGGGKTNGAMKPVCFGGAVKAETNDQTRLASGRAWEQDVDKGANWRDVWSLSHEGFDGAHFAVMPSEIARRAIVAGCPPGGLVLDPFTGAGTTGIVAAREGMRFIGTELYEKNADISRQRIADAYAQGKLDLFAQEAGS